MRVIWSIARVISLALVLALVSIVSTGDALAMPASNILPARKSAVPSDPVGATTVAIKHKKPRHGRRFMPRTGKRDPVPHQQGQQQNNGKDKLREKRTPRRKPAVAILCIDGRPARKTCLCADGSAPLRQSSSILRCNSPHKIAGRANPSHGDDERATLSGTKPNSGDAATEGNSSDHYVADEVLVSIALASPQGAAERLASKYGLTVVGSWPIALAQNRVIRFQLAPGQTVDGVLSSMKGDSEILGSQPNYLYQRLGGVTQAEPYPQYALVKLKIPDAHSIASGRGVKVAILDSGIDGTHPDLLGTVSSTFSAAGESEQIDDAHGTEVAGIIAARGTLQGIAPEVRLLDGRILDYTASSGTHMATTLALLRGLDWAVSEKAAVVNLSLSGPDDPLIASAVSDIQHAGIAIVAAAGNGGPEGQPSFPAAYDGVIATTATDDRDSLYSGATHGNYIDVAAPGVDIISPAPHGGYSIVSGTSFAAAHVSGVVALMLSRWPNMKPSDLKLKLEATAVDLGVAGRDADFGAGLVNARAALTE